MTEAMPFLQKYDITFLRPPTIRRALFFLLCGRASRNGGSGVYSISAEALLRRRIL